MKFVGSGGKQKSVPTIANWMWSLEGIEIFLKKMQIELSLQSV